MRRDSLEPFVAPEHIDDWLSLSTDPTDSSSENVQLRRRVDEYARSVYRADAHLKDAGSEEPLKAEDLVRMTKMQRRANADLDALSICKFPPLSSTRLECHILTAV